MLCIAAVRSELDSPLSSLQWTSRNNRRANGKNKWWRNAPPKCSPTNQCTFFDHFNTLNTWRWTKSDNYANGDPFNAWWSADQVSVDAKRNQLKLTLAQHHHHGKPFKSGQIKSNNWHGYGCYEVRMRPVAQTGVISTFFAYTGPWDAAPGKSGAHNEIDIEFVRKSASGKLMLQTNYFTNGQGGNEHDVHLPFDPSSSMHNYGFRWTQHAIQWYVNGQLVHTAKNNIPKVHVAPLRIFLSLWPVSWKAAAWGGHFAYAGHRTAAYDWVRFTKGSNCNSKWWKTQ